MPHSPSHQHRAHSTFLAGSRRRESFSFVVTTSVVFARLKPLQSPKMVLGMSRRLLTRCRGCHDGFQPLQVGGKLAPYERLPDEHEDSHDNNLFHTHVDRHPATGILRHDAIADMSTLESTPGDVPTHAAQLFPLDNLPRQVPCAFHDVQASRTNLVWGIGTPLCGNHAFTPFSFVGNAISVYPHIFRGTGDPDRSLYVRF
jgi:hypothetical protein